MSPAAPAITQARSRELEALKLRRAGLRYAGIGAELGVTESAAARIVKRALKKLAAETLEEAAHLRDLEAARLDELLGAVWEKALGGEPAAVSACLRIAERRAKLYNLNGAEAVEAIVTVDLSATGRAIAARSAEIEATIGRFTT